MSTWHGLDIDASARKKMTTMDDGDVSPQQAQQIYQQQQQSGPAASIPLPSETDMPYTYKPLSGSLAYPGAKLPGKQLKNKAGSATQTAAARYAAQTASGPKASRPVKRGK